MVFCAPICYTPAGAFRGECRVSGCNLARQDPIVRKYVGALYVVARRLHSEKIVHDEMIVIRDLIAGMGLSDGFFRKISRLRDLGRKFADELTEQVQFSQITRNFIRLLVQNQRVHLLPEICSAYAPYIEQLSGKRTVYVTYAGRFGAQEKKSLMQNLQSALGDSIELIVEKDPSLINGIRLQHNGKILDYSLRSKLERLRRSIRGESYGV